MFEEKIREYLDDALGNPKVNQRQIRYNCPVCDKGHKYNLEICINPKSQRYKKANCWGCSLKGLRTILKNYGKDGWRQEEEFSNGEYVPQEIIEEDNGIKLPEGCFPALHTPAVERYLLWERALNKDIIIERNILFCTNQDEKLFNHIIFPFYEDGKLIGYASQDFKTKKYKNHRDLNFIAYDEFINWEFPVIATEGIYDALSVVNASPALGTKLSKAFLNKINDKRVIVGMDNNVEFPMIEKKKMVETLYDWRAKRVMIFDMKIHKDFNAYLHKDKQDLKQQLLVQFELISLQ